MSIATEFQLALTLLTDRQLEEKMGHALMQPDCPGFLDLMAELNRRSVEKWKQTHLPYPWCMDPARCSKLSSCPRDPNCGE